MGFNSDGRGLDVEGAPRPEERRKLKLRPLSAARSLHCALSRPRTGRVDRSRRCRAHHADRAGGRAPNDRFRLFRQGGAADRQLFCGDDRGRGCARDLERDALLPGHDFGRARRGRPAVGCLRAPDTIVVIIFRYSPHRRNRFAADCRHDPDQIGGRRLGFNRVAQSAALLGWRGHDGGHQPTLVPVRAWGDSDHRASARWFWTRRTQPRARRAGYACRGIGLCGRTHRRRSYAAGLYQREARAVAVLGRGRACFCGRTRCHKSPRRAHGYRHLSGLCQHRGRVVGRRTRRACRCTSRPVASDSLFFTRCLRPAVSAS